MKLPNISIQIKIGVKTIYFTPLGISKFPETMLNLKEMLALVMVISAMRYSHIWWLADLFKYNKTYKKLPHSFIIAIYSKFFKYGNSGLATALKVQDMPMDRRKPDLYPTKQWIINHIPDKNKAEELYQIALEERLTNAELNERCSVYK